MAALAYTVSRDLDRALFCAAFMAATAITMVLFISFAYRAEKKLGPILHIDLPEKHFVLPRLKREFALAEIEGFCLMIETDGDSSCVQIQLQVRAGERLLLASSSVESLMKEILKGLTVAAPLEARVYTRNRKAPNGWREESFAAYCNRWDRNIFNKPIRALFRRSRTQGNG